jgi:sugar-specific transcriptional regulator TrmB
MINLEQLVKELMSLGLTSQEAQIYVLLAQNNSDKKKEVIGQLEIGEQELTDSLQRLTKKGFLETKLEDSNFFSVIPLQIVMERLIKEKLREVQLIRGEIREYNSP